MDSDTEYNNQSINELKNQGKITQDEYNVLFHTKEHWTEKSNATSQFDEILRKVIRLQSESKSLNLNHIKFYKFVYTDYFTENELPISFDKAKFIKYTDFGFAVFNKSVSFNKTIFEGETNFGEVQFKGSAVFFKSVFHKKSAFYKAHFYGVSDFKGCHFYDDIFFWYTVFEEKADFVGDVFEKLISFGKSSFFNLDLINVRLDTLDFLETTGWKNGCSVTLTKTHFENKETARLIKSSFEKQNNITESNKYFEIEQDFYIKYLKQVKTEPNRISTLVALYLNKIISNFGTDWVRPLLLLFSLSYVFMFFYVSFDSLLPQNTESNIIHFTKSSDLTYILTMIFSWSLLYFSTFYKETKYIFWLLVISGIILGAVSMFHYEHTLKIQNYLVQLTNPINAFKSIGLYSGIEIYGAFVRILVVTILYQFTMSFRQNTRRK